MNEFMKSVLINAGLIIVVLFIVFSGMALGQMLGSA